MQGRLLQIAKRVLAESDFDRVLAAALDGLIELSGAERGMVVLFDEAGEPLVEAARNLERRDVERPEFEVSRSILQRVREEKAPFTARNVLDDPALGHRRSVLRLGILSVICLPIRRGEAVLGVVYLDNRTAQGVFTAETAALAASFADFVSLAAAHALERRRLAGQVEGLLADLRREYRFEAILGDDPKLVEALRRVAQVADSEVTVLVQGESGTGKELVARALHFNSRRRDRPFVAVNCGALPETLLDSELFGHVRGAFTGAVADHPGWFERAQGGTIFLDEVGDMPPSLQVKLLRVLESREYARLGSSAVRKTDARVVAATHRDLAARVREGAMREDLLYRLHVVEITLPPLRERRGDLPLLVRTFLERANRRHGAARRLAREAERLFLAYDWPGNVRQLQNVLERAVLIARGEEIGPEDLPDEMRAGPVVLAAGRSGPEARAAGDGLAGTYHEAKRRVVEAFERDYVRRCLVAAHGNVSAAARAAGLDAKNFRAKVAAHGLDPAAFKKRPARE